MKITVTQTIDINGKIDQKIASAETETNPWDGMSMRSDERTAANMARALFESMQPQMMVAPSLSTAEVYQRNKDAITAAIMGVGLADPAIGGAALGGSMKRPHTPRVKKLLEMAELVSRDYGRNYVGCESLLIAMARMTDETHFAIIKESGITEEKIAATVGIQKQ